MFEWTRRCKTKALWTTRGAAAIAAVVLAISFTAPLPAQNVPQNGQLRANDRPIEVPDSTNELPGDVGARAHTNHLILLRPERIQQATSSIPVGETPGSLACVYQTVSPTTGCPITGNYAKGNNGLVNPNGGSGTIALVDAYDYPTAPNDFAVFSTQFGLPCIASTSNCSDQFATATRPGANQPRTAVGRWRQPWTSNGRTPWRPKRKSYWWKPNRTASRTCSRPWTLPAAK